MDLSYTGNYQSEDRTVFVGGVPLSASEQDIWNHFARYGRVINVKVPIGKDGEKKGYAFVSFESSIEAKLAMQKGPHLIKSKKVAVRQCMSDAQAASATKQMQERKIFASGFKTGVSEEEVARLFSQFGPVCKVLSPRGGIGKRGFCYIVMSHQHDFEYLINRGQVDLCWQTILLTPAATKANLKFSSCCTSVGDASNSTISHSDKNELVIKPIQTSKFSPQSPRDGESNYRYNINYAPLFLMKNSYLLHSNNCC